MNQMYMDPLTLTILVAGVGLLIGSFLTVCIYRIPFSRIENPEGESDIEVPVEPRKDIGINNPKRSFCPACNKQLKWYHNIPLFSWLALGGKCSFCKASISVRYPAVELLSCLAALLSFATYGPTLTGLLIFIFVAALIVISFIDYDHYIIPNVISIPGTLIGLIIAGVNEFFSIFSSPIVPGVKDSLLGILVGAGFLLVISEGYLRLRKKEGLGMGDVKLLAMTGALFGWRCSVYTIFIGSLLGSIIGISLILICGRKMSQHLPFGPYLAVATILYLFYGHFVMTDPFGGLGGISR